MSALVLTEAQWAAQTRAERAVKDKSYRRYPLGEEVGHFLRAKRVEGCKQSTRDSYETVLCALVLDHRDFATLERFAASDGLDLLNEFLDARWGESEPTTLDQRTKAVNSFFGWAYETRRTSRPVRVKRRWQGDRHLRVAHELASISAIVAAQPTLRDQIFVLLMGRIGLRKMEAGRLQVRDVDLARDIIRINETKTGEPAELPIQYADVREALYLWLQEERRHPETYIFHPRGHPERVPDQSTVHRRFAACLERARVTHFPMHELRHSAGHFIHRATGDPVAAKELLRHSSLDMTMRYLHPTIDDLRAAMKKADQ